MKANTIFSVIGCTFIAVIIGVIIFSMCVLNHEEAYAEEITKLYRVYVFSEKEKCDDQFIKIYENIKNICYAHGMRTNEHNNYRELLTEDNKIILLDMKLKVIIEEM